MPRPIGQTRWAIAEGYIPGRSTGPEPEMTSHETACILNTGDQDAHVRITLFFEDREPAGPYELTVPARRTKHLWFNELDDPEPVPTDTDYASLIESTCRSSCSTPDSTRDRPRTPCSQPSPMPSGKAAGPERPSRMGLRPSA